MSLAHTLLQSSSLFQTPDSTLAWRYLFSFRYPWEILPSWKHYLAELCRSLDSEEYEDCGENIRISRRATVAGSAQIMGPCIIEAGAEIRHGAFLRGGVLIGKHAVVGNSCEVKNSLLFDGVQIPHFNYVGDSILGHRAHLGAGAITSNVKGDRSEIRIRSDGEMISTGLTKLGAILGDGVEVGCNAVLNPGTVIGVGSRIYPLSSVRGYIPSHVIVKGDRGMTEYR